MSLGELVSLQKICSKVFKMRSLISLSLQPAKILVSEWF